MSLPGRYSVLFLPYVVGVLVLLGCAFPGRADGKSLSAAPTAPRQRLCGHLALQSVLRFNSKDPSLDDLTALSPTTQSGTSIADLLAIIDFYGMHSLYGEFSASGLFELGKPAILHVNGDHFIALLPDREEGGFVGIDYPETHYLATPRDIRKHWDWCGVGIVISSTPIPAPEAMWLVEASSAMCIFSGAVFVLSIILLGRKFYSARSEMRWARKRPTHMCISFLLMTGVFLAATKVYGAVKTPCLRVEPLVFDYGLVFEDTREIDAAFTIMNTGSADLVIEDTKTSCACAVTSVPHSRIGPGERTKMFVRVNIARVLGEQNEYAVIVCNDPENSPVRLQIHGERRREFEIQPRSIQFGLVPKGGSRRRYIRIIPGSPDKAVFPEMARFSAPFLDLRPVVEFRNSESHLQDVQQGQLFEVLLLPSGSPGVFSEHIEVPCQGNGKRQLTIPITGEIEASYRISPCKAMFGLLSPDTGPRLVRVNIHSSEPFQVVEAYAKADWLEVRVLESGTKKAVLAFKAVPTKMPHKHGCTAVSLIVKNRQSTHLIIPAEGFLIEE